MRFFVAGLPRAQGSKRHVGRGIMVEMAKDLQPWRDSVTAAALAAADREVFSGPVEVRLAFAFPRLKGHFGSGRNAGQLKESAPYWKDTAPDIDKLCRAVLDALVAAGILRDDSLVASLVAHKRYRERPGVGVEIRPI